MAIDLVAICDALCIIAGGLVPGAIYSYAGSPIDWASALQASILAGVFAALCFKAWGLYDDQTFVRINTRPALVVATLMIAVGTVSGFSFPNAFAAKSILGWHICWLIASSLLIQGSRTIVLRLFRRMAAAGRFDERIAVFGAGTIARRVHDHLAGGQPGFSFAGVYDDRMNQDRLNPEGLTVRGRLADLVDAARAGEIDRIVLALPQTADRRVAEIARKLEHLPVNLHVVTHLASDFLEFGAAHTVSSIGPVGLIDVKKRPIADWSHLIKAGEDYTLAALFLVLSAPLFPLIALAIKLDSRGPIFFVQRRRGLNQRIIKVVKFRTMRVLEDDMNVRQVAKDDPRITAVGRFLRSTSLDELPQLINVLRGEMSLVGPRPHALVHDEQYGEMIESYANRYQVKPGITGLAQVRGHRGETSTADKLRARIESDILYIKSWSLMLDLKILAHTCWAVLTRKNAH